MSAAAETGGYGVGELLTLDIPNVLIDGRLRLVDPDRVAELALSMAETGQIVPIEVGQNTGGGWPLISGAHRLAAAAKAGLKTIKAVVYEGTKDQARLREIDENLYRAELTPYDQAAFLAERRAIYERVHGQVKSGPRSRGGIRPNLGSIPQLSFFDDVTAKFGLPKTNVKRALRRSMSISPEVWHRLAGHPVTKNGAELDRLAGLNEAQQRQAVKLLFQDAHPAKNITAALRAMREGPEESPDEIQFRRLCDAWRKAGKSARLSFREFLATDDQRRAA